MIVTSNDELRAYLPSSVYQEDSSLLTLMEETEENVLVPILGRSLYDMVCELYQEFVEQYGGVTALSIQGKDVTPEVALVRLCQSPVVYMTLARSTGILNVNLNEGGGMNQLTTTGFDRPDKDAINRFERDAFFKGRRGIDRLLLFLEEDAQSDAPKFVQEWRKSRYFYKQGDLLFTTAIEMNRFLDIDESREKFISMLPDIRYCQNVYISPAIGDELLEALVDWCTGKHPGGAVPLEGEAQRNPDAYEEVWRKAVDRLRMALALYVEARRPEKQRRYSENEASLALHKAKEYIAQHQEVFGDAILSSPIYVPPVEETTAPTPAQTYVPFDDSNPDNAIMVFRPGYPLRH